jgi:hypothetical protein
MSDRNKVFKRRYTIEIKGITTNHFMEKFIDSYIGRMVLALSDRFAQIEIVTMTAQDIDLQEKLMAVYQCEKCGAHKYMEGADCLFCAAEADHANTNV